MISLENRPPMVENEEGLDPRLFAHIHLDNRLIGSHLQGDTFSRSSRYILKSLEFFIKNKSGLDPQVKERIQASLENTQKLFKSLVESELEIERLNLSIKSNYTKDDPYSTKGKAPYLSDVNSIINDTAERMAQQAMKTPLRSMLLSGGWAGAGGSSGHQMVYELIPNDDGSFTFLIFNTGEGIKHHLRTSKMKDKYSPVKAFQIEKGLKQEELAKFMAELIKPMVYPNIKKVKDNSIDWKKHRIYNADRVYQEAINKIYLLNGKEIDPKPFSKKTTVGQLSGTCTMRVLMPMLHASMQGEAFQQYLYQLRLQSIIDHYRIQKNKGALHQHMIQRQLIESISKLSRTTVKFMKRRKNKAPILLEDQAKQYLALLKQIDNELKAQSKLNDKEEKLNAELKLDQPLDAHYVITLENTIQHSYTKQKSDQDNTPSPSKDKPKTDLKQALPAREHYKTIAEFLKACHETMLNNDRQGFSQAIIHEVETLFFSIPLNAGIKNIIGELDQKSAKETLNYLQGILGLYGKHCLFLNPYPNARQSMTSYTMTMVASLLADQYFKDSQGIKSIRDLLPSFSLTDPQSVSLDPAWDKRLAEIQNFKPIMELLAQDQRSVHLKSLETTKKASKDIKIESIEEFDQQFFNHHLDEDTRKALKKEADRMIDQDNVSLSHDEAIRFGFYRICNQKLYTGSDKIEQAQQDYDILLQVNQLAQEFKLINTGRYDYFNSRGMVTENAMANDSDKRFQKMHFEEWPEKERRDSFNQEHYKYSHQPFAESRERNTLQQFMGLREQSPIKRVLFDESSSPLPQSSNDAILIGNQIKYSDQFKGPLKREVPLLRIQNNECRVLVTKDFFESNLELFNNSEYQTLCLVNFFSPNLLTTVLTRNPGFANNLYQLIDKSFRYHLQNKELSHGAIFSFQISYYLLKYLKSMPNASAYKEVISQLQAQSKSLNESIEWYQKVLIHKKGKQQENRAKLNDLLILNFIKIHAEPPETIGFNTLKNLYSCLFNVKQLGRGHQNSYLYYEFMSSTEPMIKRLQHSFGNLEKDEQSRMIHELIKELMVPDLLKENQYTTTLEYPILKIKTHEQEFTLDLSQGSLTTLKSRVGFIPKEAYDSTFKQMFGNEPIKAELQDQDEGRTVICEFVYPQTKDEKTSLEQKHSREQAQQGIAPLPRRYRIIVNKIDRTSTIQALFLPENTWFEVLTSYGINNYTVGAAGLEHLVWKELEGFPPSFYITDPKAKATLKIDPNQDKKTTYQSQELDPKGNKTGYVLLNQMEHSSAKPLYDFFGKIEDIAQIEIFQALDFANAKIRYKVKLPRFGLALYGTIGEDNTLEFVLSDNPDIKLIMSNKEVLPGFKHGLFFENKKTKEMTAWVPKQDYIASSKTQDEYYKLLYDTSNSIPIEILSKNNFGNLSWNYEKSQSFYKFKLKNEEPRGISVRDNLSLAYLYLANHQPSKAMEALRHCVNLRATEEEIELLMKIMVDTPRQDYDQTTGTESLYIKARTNEPDTAAVRLYAASLLAQQQQISLHRPAFDLALAPLNSSEHYASANEAYRAYQRHKISTFYNKDFIDIAKTIQQDYYQRLDNVSIDLKVLPIQELTVLRTAYQGLPPEDPISIKNRWTQLEFKQLTREKRELTKKKAKLGLDPLEQIHLEHIQAQLKVGNQRLEVTQVLEQRTQTLQLPSLSQIKILSDFIFNRTKSNIFIRQQYHPWELSVNNDPKIFIDSFINLYSYISTTSNVQQHIERKTQHETFQQFAKYLNNYLGSEPNVIRLKDDVHEESMTACKLLSYVLHRPDLRWPDPSSWDLSSEQGFFTFFTKILEVCTLAAKQEPLKYTVVERSTQMSVPKTELETKSKADHIPLILEAMNDSRTPLQIPASLDKSQPNLQPMISPLQNIEELRDPFINLQRKKFLEDLETGRTKNVERSQKQAYYAKTLTEEQRKAIKESLEKDHKQHESLLTQSMNSILILANQAISGEKASVRTLAKKLGKKIGELNFNDLIWLYLQQDATLFQQRTQLDPKSISELNQKIHQYLSLKTQTQHDLRTLKTLETLEKLDKSSQEFSMQLTKLGDELMAQRSYEPKDHPELLVFEYYEDLRLRPEQTRLIQQLLTKEKFGLGYSNEIIQLIMGGGKSKVLLPLLALKKANGSNLSIIEVPASLFETNVADLTALTQRLFGKKAYPLRFDRETDCSVKNLKLLYATLDQEVRAARNYIITTAESIQSLELKYLELLAKSPVDSEQILTLENILKLIKYKGDALIDECDTVLDSKRELNYTQGEKRKVPKSTLSFILKMYSLFDQIKITLPTTTTTLNEVMLGNAVIPTEEHWKQAFNVLANALIHHPKSPLLSAIDALDSSQKGQILKYISNDLESTPEFLSKLSDEARNQIALIKGEVDLFHTTLKRKSNEHYGFPLSADYPGFKELSIPYFANNTPNEKAEFGSIYEIINYTIQLHKQRNLISIDIIQSFISDFIHQAKEEIANTPGKMNFENTLASREFQALTGIALSSIDIEDKSILPDLQKRISQQEKAVDHIMLNYILSRVEQHPFILRSNGINHVSQYRSTQGITGTPWNVGVYHSRLNFDPSLNLGTDGQTIDLLMQKKPNITVASNLNPEAIINQSIVQHPKSEKVRAFIDVGAIFKGLSNVSVAEKMAKALAFRPGNKIKHILYFNEDNVLCALPFELKKGDKQQMEAEQLVIGAPKVIGSTDPINIQAITEGGSDQYFTYYDQRHSTGTDIQQAQDTIGITSIDIDTKARDLWQGCMRLRQLAANQTIEILMPKSVAETSVQKKGWDINDIIHLVQNNQIQSLGELHLRAAIDKMQDLVRSHLLDKIYHSKNVQEKVTLQKKFSSVFLISNIEDPWTKFGHCEPWTKTDAILDHYLKQCLLQYETLASEAGLFSEGETKNISHHLEQIKAEALKNTLAEYKHIPASDEEHQVLVQRIKEQKKESKKEKQAEKQMENSWTANIVFHQPWNDTIPRKLPIGEEHPYPVEIESLNSMISSATLPQFEFSPNIFVTRNFKRTIEDHKNPLDIHGKPVHFFMVIKEPGHTELKTLIITQEEASEFTAYLDEHRKTLSEEGYQYWIRTPHDTQWDGQSLDIPFKEYQNLLMQIQCFNLDLDQLLERDTNDIVDWFLEGWPEKLAFIEEQLHQRHPDKMNMLAGFKQHFKGHIDKKLAETKIEMEDFFQAIRHQDINAVDAFFSRLNQIKSFTLQKMLLNKTSNKTGLSLLAEGVKSSNPIILKRLLNAGLKDSPDYETSALRLALREHKKEILDLLFTSSKWTQFSDASWANFMDEVFETKDPYLIKSMVSLVSNNFFNVEPYIDQKLQTLVQKDLKEGLEDLKLFTEMTMSKLGVWKKYFLLAASRWPNDTFMKLVNELQHNSPYPRLKSYLKGDLAPDANSLLSDIQSVNKELFLQLLQDPYFGLQKNDSSSFIQGLKSQDKQVLSSIIDTLGTQDTKFQNEVLNSEAFINHFNELFSKSFPSQGGKNDFFIDLLLQMLRITPSVDNLDIIKNIVDYFMKQPDEKLCLEFYEIISHRTGASAKQLDTISNLTLESAIKTNKWKVVHALLKKGVKSQDKSVLETLMFWAVDNGQVDIVRELISQGVDPNILDTSFRKGTAGPSLLGRAMAQDNLEIISILLKAGADLFVSTSWESYSPLKIAFNDYPIQNLQQASTLKGQFLLKHFGDPNYEKFQGMISPYREWAFKSLDLSTLAVLRKLTLIDFWDLNRLLSHAYESNSLEALTFLAQQEPKLSDWKIDFQPVLHYAIQQKNGPFVINLLKAGFKCEAKELLEAIRLLNLENTINEQGLQKYVNTAVLQSLINEGSESPEIQTPAEEEQSPTLIFRPSPLNTTIPSADPNFNNNKKSPKQ